MPLPSELKSAIYKETLPGSDKTIAFRPWNFGEEKNLLVASESGSAITKFSTVAELIRSCTFGKIKIEDLPQFYFEWLFIKIREKSEGEIINTLVNCPDDKKSKNQRIQIKLPEIKLEIDGSIEKILEVGELETGEKLFIELRWPTVGFAIKVLESTQEIESYIKTEKDKLGIEDEDKIPEGLETIINKKWELQNSSMLKLMIKKLYDDNGQVYDLSDVTDEEFMVYMNKSIPSSFQKFEEFIDNVPTLSHELKWKCRTCGKDHSINIEGLESFL